ncbi:M3 family metallopeptidase [Pseudomonas sp. MAFF 212408]|uniref:M3 family metallopeptidase n=1 Tax=Pseudomonas kitaguniensis TaxID=2607908 RepID=A0A5N7KF02_9PSED|nr:M3 family metallopeptidase [Pseudomonas kitaguniensis]MPR00743.1 M3 family metallopeptidase [Pseudomonas kitaguniensis]
MYENNPLLQPYDLPPFSAIRTEHLVPAVQTIIAENRAAITAIITSQTHFPTWDDLVLAVDELDTRLDITLSILHLIDSTNRDKVWHEAVAHCNSLGKHYKSEQAQNNTLYQLYRQLANSPIAVIFSNDRKNTLHKILRQYQLAGADLPTEKQLQLNNLNMEISELQHEYLNRIEDANKAWSKHIEDSTLISGLPRAAQARMYLAAQSAGKPGWLLALSEQSYREVLTYADSRALRQEIMLAYYTRASDTGPDALAIDNELVLTLLLDDRHQKAQLLGYPNFAQLALVDQMADTPEQVIAFLDQHIELARSTFSQDRKQLQHYAALHGITRLEPWDYDYLANKVRQDAVGISNETVREYFPLETVLQRLCSFTKQLFGIDLIEQITIDTWHPNVRAFEVREYAEPIGYLFIDPYRRESGAGLGSTLGISNRQITAEGRLRRPVAVLSSRLPPPTEVEPCQLDHLQLRVLLHEFGHCLQHLLTAAPYRMISGIGQLSHDRAEFVSQVLEQFCFAPQFLIGLSSHFQTGDSLPEDIANKIVQYIHTQTSRETASLLLTSLVDFELHRTYGDGRTPHEVFVSVNKKIGLLQWPDEARPVNGFEQLVSDYGARIYSYKWSGVLASQAFDRWKREGLNNPIIGTAFREAFITPGDSPSLEKSLDLFLSHSPMPTRRQNGGAG